MPRFLENRVYQPSGGDKQCSEEALTGVLGVQSALVPRTIKSEDFEDVQADENALYDQNGNVLHYNAFYSQDLCSSTEAGFAPGTLEVKAAWMTLRNPDPEFFSISVEVNGERVFLALVGLHLAIWTPNHPEMVWASWEHKRNAPLCDGTSASGEWLFASEAAATCLQRHPTGGTGPSPYCESFKFNTPQPYSGSVPTESTPTNVCRKYNHGNQDGESVNGNDNTANIAAIEELNGGLVGPTGLLTMLPSEHPMSVWANYEMVGGIWTKGGAASGTAPVPNTQGPPNPNSPQRGSLELANMSLETFQQGDTSAIPNCFGCHVYDPSKPLDVSHIQSRLLDDGVD